jgi:DNA-binding CsgD family transcriptional regulator/tetratricopeptide (TPR) repeat protein
MIFEHWPETTGPTPHFLGDKLATFVKVFGLGLRRSARSRSVSMSRSAILKKNAVRSPTLDQAKRSPRKPAWGEVVSELSAADRLAPLDPMQLVELAQASMLIGMEREGSETLSRAHQAFLKRGETQPAARCAFWLGFTAMLNGDIAQASGWLSRAERLLDQHPDCVEKGYLLLPVGYRMVHGGEEAKAYEAFGSAVKIGERFGDADLMALARQGQGRALIRKGEIVRGVSLLDEAMIAVTAGEVTPLTAGGIYCSVLDACGEIFDLRRAQEWTAALERWCASQPDLVPYRGHCLVRRAEILQLHGAWEDALVEAQRACERLSHRAPRTELGGALYRIAELCRLRGDFDAAENAYREASRWQRVAQPGLALLRFAQGQFEAASVVIRRAAEEIRELGARAKILDALVEIVLGVNDVPAARAAAAELATISERYGAPQLEAMSAGANGMVLLAEQDAKAALGELRRAWEIWCELDAPYEAARTRILMARACNALDDCDAAQLEVELACEVFQRLGAKTDLARAAAIPRNKNKKDGKEGPLTTREIEVLKLVAAGKSNRAIAAELEISEKTVARHLSNIFNKLDLSSRAAATAFAYKTELVKSSA